VPAVRTGDQIRFTLLPSPGANSGGKGYLPIFSERTHHSTFADKVDPKRQA
jgi:hypothetical protein